MAWEQALQRVLQTTYAELERVGTVWAVVGSVATALQGCRVAPRDLDLSFAEPAGVHRFAQLMTGFLAEACDFQPGHEAWLSTRDLPVSSPPPDPTREVWTFGRWLVGGFKVEAAHIARPSSHSSNAPEAGIWETGQKIWPYLRRVSFEAYRVPVVPLKIQLGTSFRRGLQDRIEATIALFRQQGCDRALVEKALPAKYMPLFEKLIVGAAHEPVGH